MNLLISLTLFACGIALLILGSGPPATDQTIWVLIGGGVCTVVGLVGAQRARITSRIAAAPEERRSTRSELRPPITTPPFPRR